MSAPGEPPPPGLPPAESRPSGCLAPLAGVIDHVIAIPIPGADDAQDAQTLSHYAREMGLSAEAAADFDAALAVLKRGKPATVLAAGSLYLAGELLKTHE